MLYRNAIDKARLDKNLGQRKLAELTSIPIVRVSHIVNGHTGISIDEAETFARVLEIPMSELVELTTKEYHDRVTAIHEEHEAKLKKTLEFVERMKREHGIGSSGIDECPNCGGTLHWSISEINGHIAAFCETPACTAVME